MRHRTSARTACVDAKEKTGTLACLEVSKNAISKEKEYILTPENTLLS
jgi:hypothetical protein